MGEKLYVTTDHSELQECIGLDSRQTILINRSSEQFVLLHEITMEQWREVGVEVRNKIFKSRMLEFGSYRDDRGVIRAFYTDPARGLLYLKPSWLAGKLNIPLSTFDPARHLHALSESEQKELWARIRPESYERCRDAFARDGWRPPALDLDAIFEDQDPIPAIHTLIRCLSLSSKASHTRSTDLAPILKGREFKFAAHLVLATLCEKGWLLYAVGLYEQLAEVNRTEQTGIIRPGAVSKVVLNESLFGPDLPRVAMERYLAQGKKQELSTGAYLPWFLLSTTMSGIGDLSPELLDATRTLGLRSYKWWDELRIVFEAMVGPATFPQPPKSRRGYAIRTRSLDWVLAENPDLEPWTTLYERTIANDFRTYTSGEYTNARHFFRWILAMGSDAPTPETLSKRQIRNEGALSSNNMTFREFLDAHRSISSRSIGAPLRPTTKAAAILQLGRVMERLRQENLQKIEADPTLAGRIRADNPVSEQDSVWKAATPRRTHRSAIPSDILDFSRESLLSRDEEGVPTFEWARENQDFKRDWIIIDGSHSGKWPYERQLDENRIAVWQPTRALGLYTMLELPLRSFQMRWLDSGAGDEYIWDLASQGLVPNPRPTAERGRREGVFRPVSDNLFHGADAIGLYITTNKAQLWNPEDDRGFTIPWPSDEFYRVIDIQRQWCEFATSVFFTEPVRLSDDDLNVSDNIAHLLPYFHVLFRDASNFAGASRPISRSKIDAAWSTLCAYVQEKLEEKGVHVKLVANRQGRQRKKHRAIHDLHSLRVSGITGLYLKGVPVEVISKYIAGHAAIAMTLHYEASDPIEIRRRLATWLHGQQSQRDTKRVEELVSQLDEGQPLSIELAKAVLGEEALTRLFIGNEFASSRESGLAAAQHVSGSWMWFGDGICPGAKCSEGDESGGPVKGGARSCGNCRFFMTGTAFIYGQVHRCNQLMYELRSLGKERVLVQPEATVRRVA